MSLTGVVRPYGDTTGDGRVQVSFTLPVPFGDEAERARAEGAALQLAGKMGLDPAMVVHAKGMGPDFTFFIVYGRVSHLVDLSAVTVAEREFPVLPAAEVNLRIRSALGRKLVVVGGIYYDAFLKRADELGVRDAIITTGAAPKADVPDYLATADVECHSLQGIGFGTACLETLAAGTPQVAAITEDHFGDIKIIDREHMHLVPVGDAKAARDYLSGGARVFEAQAGVTATEAHFLETA